RINDVARLDRGFAAGPGEYFFGGGHAHAGIPYDGCVGAVRGGGIGRVVAGRATSIAGMCFASVILYFKHIFQRRGS
ncbi:MAG: hypothetical protein KIT18_13860, partial [Burkholderiales bacterium]|nr:hypothetical protein [Burkholderiales bacterium]